MGSMFNKVARAHMYTAQCNAAVEQQPEGWRIVDPPPCLGGSTHRWVPVDTHSTPVPERDGCGWPMSSDSTAVQCRNTPNMVAEQCRSRARVATRSTKTTTTNTV